MTAVAVAVFRLAGAVRPLPRTTAGKLSIILGRDDVELATGGLIPMFY
jgi:hypothetical protein